VLNAAFEGSNLGYRMTVPPDLTAGSNSEMEETALKMVSLHIGLVAHSSELLRLWSDAQRTRAA
jgi:nicotinamidase-related amidase